MNNTGIEKLYEIWLAKEEIIATIIIVRMGIEYEVGVQYFNKKGTVGIPFGRHAIKLKDAENMAAIIIAKLILYAGWFPIKITTNKLKKGGVKK